MSSVLHKPDDDGPQPSDWRELIDRAKGGCEESFEEMFEQIHNYLILIAGANIGSGLQRKFGASDIVQSGMFNAYAALDRFQGSTEAEFRAWVKAIVVNSLHDQTRRYEAQKRRIDRERPLNNLTLRDDTTSSQIALQNEEKMDLQRCISRLPAIEQRVIELRHRYGYGIVEIAGLLNITERVARSRLNSGIEKLKFWLQEPDSSGP